MWSNGAQVGATCPPLLHECRHNKNATTTNGKATIFQFHCAEIGPGMVSSWFNFALTWSKEQHAGSSRLQVGPKLAQACPKLTQSWLTLVPGRPVVSLNENPAGFLLTQEGSGTKSRGARRHRGCTKDAPRMHRGGTRDAPGMHQTRICTSTWALGHRISKELREERSTAEV